MVIGPDYVFLAVPRTASYWMVRRFLPLFGGQYQHPHHGRIVPTTQQQKFTFAVVRNPYDRMLSIYHHLVQCDITYNISAMTFPRFMEFVQQHWGLGAWPQTEFLSSARIDTVVRFETLKDDLAALPPFQIDFQAKWRKAGKPLNTSTRDLPWRDEALQYEAIIWEHSRDDFEEYGYQRMR